MDRKNYIFKGYNQAVSDLKRRQFFSPNSASIKYDVFKVSGEETIIKNGLKILSCMKFNLPVQKHLKDAPKCLFLSLLKPLKCLQFIILSQASVILLIMLCMVGGS